MAFVWYTKEELALTHLKLCTHLALFCSRSQQSKIQVLRDVKSCLLVITDRRCKRSLLPPPWVSKHCSFWNAYALRMEDAGSSATPATIYWSVRRHILKGVNTRQCCHKNLKSVRHDTVTSNGNTLCLVWGPKIHYGIDRGLLQDKILWHIQIRVRVILDVTPLDY
jgi:hypothetical protein